MRHLLCGALPCLLGAQVPASSFPPSAPTGVLTFEAVLQRARPGLDQLRLDAWLAERNRELAGSSGFLREGPTVGWSAGPRRSPGLTPATDQAGDVDLPLFLSPGARRGFAGALEAADPVLREAARREVRLRLRQGYLDLWLAQRVFELREQDVETVETWLKAARVRREVGADPAFQVALVEGEVLKARMDRAESRKRVALAWAALRALADLPASPLRAADPDPVRPDSGAALAVAFQASPLRKALQARLEVERERLRHQEALALSRWSLRGSYAREGQDRIAKIGFAYRFSRPGEAQALRHEAEAGAAALRREIQGALVELEGRFQAAQASLEDLAGIGPAPDFQAAIRAVGLRLQAGRERPSEVLPIRRQLLEAEIASLTRQHAQQLLTAELTALTQETRP